MKKLLGSLIFFCSFLLLQASDLQDANHSVKTAIPLEVAPLHTDDLVDKQNSLPQVSYNLQELLPYLNGLLLFLAGFVVAKISASAYFTKPPLQQNPHHDKIDKTEDEKALLQLLLSLDDTRYHESIIRLEKSIYSGEKVDFEALKERLLKV